MKVASAMEKNKARKWQGLSDAIILCWVLEAIARWAGDVRVKIQWRWRSKPWIYQVREHSRGRNKYKGRNLQTFYKPHGERILWTQRRNEGKGSELKCQPQRYSFNIIQLFLTFIFYGSINASDYKDKNEDLSYHGN